MPPRDISEINLFFLCSYKIQEEWEWHWRRVAPKNPVCSVELPCGISHTFQSNFLVGWRRKKPHELLVIHQLYWTADGVILTGNMKLVGGTNWLLLIRSWWKVPLHVLQPPILLTDSPSPPLESIKSGIFDSSINLWSTEINWFAVAN